MNILPQHAMIISEGRKEEGMAREHLRYKMNRLHNIQIVPCHTMREKNKAFGRKNIFIFFCTTSNPNVLEHRSAQ